MSTNFIAGLGWLGAARLVSQITSWIVTVYVFRTLGPADYALVAMCGTVMMLFGLFGDFGLGASLQQSRVLLDDDVACVFGASLLLALVLYAGLWISSTYVSIYFRAPDLEWLVRIAGASLFASALLMPALARINHQAQYKKLAALDLVQTFTTVPAVLAMILAGWGVLAVVAGPVVGTFARAFVAHGVAGQIALPSWRIWHAASHLSFGGNLLLAGFLNYLANQSYVWIGGRTLSKEQMGFFSMALELAQLPLAKVMAVINQLLYPEVARWRREGMSNATTVLSGYRLLFLAMYPLFMGMAVTADTWVPLLLGEQWVDGISALQWFCLCMVLQAVCSVHATVVAGMGAVRRGLLNAGIYCVVSFSLVFAATWFGEAWALAAAAVVAVAINLFVMVTNTRKYCGFGLREVVRSALPGLTASIAMGFIVWLLQLLLGDAGWMGQYGRLTILVALGMVTYIAFLRWPWGIKIPDEIRRLRKV